MMMTGFRQVQIALLAEGISQAGNAMLLADVLDLTPSTLSRYISGERELPRKKWNLLRAYLEEE